MTNLLSSLSAVDKTTLVVGVAPEGVSVFFQQMARDSILAAQQVHDILASIFDSLNSVLQTFLTGQKTSFAEFFQGISGQLAKIGIEKAEQRIVGALHGAAGKADQTVSAITKSNEYLAQIPSALTTKIDVAMAGTIPNAGLVASRVSAAPTGAAVLTGALSPFLSMIPGGHLALGGDVTAGMSYDMGEMARERFTPNQSGTITPSKHLGTTINMPIDAQGSTNPAETEMAIHRAMGQYAPHLASGTTSAMNEKRIRTPMSSR